MKDGDLWQKLYDFVKNKGESTIRITNVKAHTDQEDVEAGRITFEERDSNNEADTAANRGTRSMTYNIFNYT